MFSAIALLRSSSPLRAIVVVLVALSVMGCSPEVTRFDTNPFLSAARSDQRNDGLSPTSVAGPIVGPGAILISRPEANLANDDKSAERASRSNSAVRVADPKERPGQSRRHDKPSTSAFAKGNAGAVPKGANLKRGSIINAQGSRTQPPQKAAKMRSPVTRAMDNRPIFDWPVHGKIVARFGPRPNGENTDGITIAVPEDTPIRPAQDGVVIYAGSAFKGFGNLVVLRHANDYVTVYAHAKELKVKRGDQIKRGDLIGTSGQSGNVSTPQVYFEVRKYSRPVDPLPLLRDSSERRVRERAASATGSRA
jgi:murein DD-endopeptidase MepM/ murein hydrolase activator NlpD